MEIEINKRTGLPLMDVNRAAKKARGGVCTIFVFPVVLTLIGYGITLAIHKNGNTAQYDYKIAIVYANEMQNAYLIAYLFSVLVIFLNMFPIIFKEKIMEASSGNLRANMFIYHLVAPGQSPSAVVLNPEGDIGLYNRGNRALYHFLENSAPMLLGLVLNTFVYPFPTLIVMAIFIFGRIVYTIGYTVGGYGSHVPGFLLDRIAFATTMGTFLYVALNGKSV